MIGNSLNECTNKAGSEEIADSLPPIFALRTAHDDVDDFGMKSHKISGASVTLGWGLRDQDQGNEICFFKIQRSNHVFQGTIQAKRRGLDLSRYKVITSARAVCSRVETKNFVCSHKACSYEGFSAWSIGFASLTCSTSFKSFATSSVCISLDIIMFLQ